MGAPRTFDEKMSMGLVVAGLVHVPYVEGNADGVDRAYASCMYTAFLRHHERRPVVSHEFVDSPVTCLRCALQDFLLFTPREIELVRTNRRVMAAQEMCARGVRLPEAKEAIGNWEAEEYADADVD